jgi:hypothetical protein
VLGQKKSSMYSSEYISGFSRPAASHLTANSFASLRKQCQIGLLARCDTIGERERVVYLTVSEHAAKEWLDNI